ncbi:MAG: D-2-hydroxyacid dehydrogenase [candidate division NC10 bacterium]|nr:D-2-hydroxyacid dehydrogenase [candidate division NC10 bacterium]
MPTRLPSLPAHPRILVYTPVEGDRYPPFLRRALPGARFLFCRSPAEVLRKMPEAEVVFGYRVPAEAFAAARRLRLIQAMSAGVDGFLRSPLPAGVPLCRAVGVFEDRMAEYTLAYLLAVSQGVPRVLAQQAAHRWSPFVPQYLQGRLLGIAGYGAIGRLVGRKARALGMRVWGLRRTGGRASGAERIFRMEEMEVFLRSLDFLVVLLPLTPETRGLIGRRALRAMRRSAWLMNIGRGPVVDEAALLHALDRGWIAGAVLDVFAEEPIPPDHPFWRHPKVIVTPHIAGAAFPEREVAVLVENLRRLRSRRPLRGLVRPTRGY